MADSYSHSEAAKKLVSELKDKGITDIDSLVRKVTEEHKTSAAQPRMLVCHTNHYCIWVKEQ
jgi:hypothetical protein